MAITSVEEPASPQKLNAPLAGISDEDHVKAWRQTAYQRTDKGNCTYCEQYGHGPVICRYINPHRRPANWKPDPKIWVYQESAPTGRVENQSGAQPTNANKKVNSTNRTQSIWARRSRRGGKHLQAAPVVNTQIAPFDSNQKVPMVTTQMTPVAANPMTPLADPPSYGNNPQPFDLITMPIVNLAARNFPRHRWAAILGYFNHVANSKDYFIDYHEYTPGEIPYRFRDQTGGLWTTLGFGRVKISLSDGVRFHGELIMHAVYCPDMPFSIMSLDMAHHALSLYYSLSTHTLNDISTNTTVAGTFQQEGMLFLMTTKDLIA